MELSIALILVLFIGVTSFREIKMYRKSDKGPFARKRVLIWSVTAVFSIVALTGLFTHRAVNITGMAGLCLVVVYCMTDKS
jgi:hypothetical protein